MNIIRRTIKLIVNLTALPFIIFRVRRLDRNLSLDQAVDFVFNGAFGLIRPLQVKMEIRELMKYVETRKPKVIVEIGTASGGTLFLFSRLASPEALIISIDLPGGGFGGGYFKCRVPLYRSFARAKQSISLLRADSHHQTTLAVVREILQNKKIDLLFIDGDHSYEGVRRDFEMFVPLVRPAGLIALHDVSVHRHDPSCRVSEFWNEIKGRYKFVEIIDKSDQCWAGIGLLFNQP